MCRGRRAWGKSRAPGKGITGITSGNGIDSAMAIMVRIRCQDTPAAPSAKPERTRFSDRETRRWNSPALLIRLLGHRFVILRVSLVTHILILYDGGRHEAPFG